MNDTIAAISTPVGVGGIGVIRVSGEKAFEICDKIFRAANKKTISKSPTHTIHYGHIVDSEGETVDEVMVSVMCAPKTFTAENTVEISTHGSPLVLKKVLSLILSAGARMAQAGEFTKRAFLNGRIDLSRAEAVIDVIHADSDISLKSALHQLEGGLFNEINKIREPLLYAEAQFGAAVDYPDDEIADLSEESLRNTLNKTIDMCTELLDNAESGRIAKEGIRCVLAGRPNVGKSSLLNALTKSSRAIVTEFEGTTRDVIEESISLEGYALRLFDTAGIRKSDNAVEKIGVDRSRAYIKSADIVLLLLDSSDKLYDEDREIISITKDKKRIIVINKSDLKQELDTNEVKLLCEGNRFVYISTKTENGIDELKKAISDICIENSGSALISNMRHIEALAAAKQSLISALEALDSGMPIDMCSIDISSALENLGLITGTSVSADIVDTVFKNFCVGK